jgi:hypothetical protein
MIKIIRFVKLCFLIVWAGIGVEALDIVVKKYPVETRFLECGA